MRFNPFDNLQPGEACWQSVPAPGVGSAISTDICVEVFACRGVEAGPTTLITAGVHGDEYEGPAAVARLAATIHPGDIRGSLLLIPVANPPAFEAGSRISPQDGANLARLFPGTPTGTPTGRLAHFLWTTFAQWSDYLIDLHSGGVEYDFVPLAGFYGDPGPANPSYAGACAMGLPVVWQLPDTAGVLSRELWRAGGVVVGAEYRGGGRLSPEGVDDYTAGILACLADWGVYGRPVEGDRPTPLLCGNDWLLASATGLFHAHCALEDIVRRGQVLATIRGLRGEPLATIRAENDGMVLGLRSKGRIVEGNWSVLIGTEMRNLEAQP